MSLSRYAQSYLKNQAKYRHLNAFTSAFNPAATASGANSEATVKPVTAASQLFDKPIAVKDNICTATLRTTAASEILKDFTSPYDATVVQLLQDAGAVVVGKTNMDEFGMGSHSTHSIFGPVAMRVNSDQPFSAGGSSGGSALAVATGQCWAALGTDTGGSVRLPAAYTGTFGFKPSYGLLSRWGVIAYANSLDTVGILASDAHDVEHIFRKLNVYDPKDPTSLDPSTRMRLGSSHANPAHLKIGIPLDYNITMLHPTVRKAWSQTLHHLNKCGHSLHPIRLPATEHALSAYYVLAPAEASSNLAKYDGVRYGSRADGMDGTPASVLFAQTRGDGFGPEVQRRILLGAFSLSAQAMDNYFIQAQKVRRLVQQDFNNIFAKPSVMCTSSSADASRDDKVDILICPTAPSPAPLLSEVAGQDSINSYMNDVLTVPASLAGLPAINVPVNLSRLEGSSSPDDGHKNSALQEYPETVGMQIIGQFGDDDLVIDCAKLLQEEGVSQPIIPEFA